jgi:hypothetical protein
LKICQSMWAGWRLPTIFELWNICSDSTSCKAARNAIGLQSNYYWSSTESDNNARQLFLLSGYSGTSIKSNRGSVVCVHD